MERYHSNAIYTLIGKLVASIIVLLQVLLLIRIIATPISFGPWLLAFTVAFLLADFFSGLAHLVMDNYANYTSPMGPLVANFHLHHKDQKYTRKPLPLIYFFESGAKLWLVPYLCLVYILPTVLNVSPVLLHMLVYFGILSSLAEVSHYLCHTSSSDAVLFLAKRGALLSKAHHVKHHLEDNRNYAFLNGMSDPLVNLIARTYFKGYKNTTDLHFAAYSGPMGGNRS